MVWFVFILIVVIALILGPILMLKPNPAQKNKEAMREVVRKRGMHFTVKKLPKQATDVEQSDPVSVYFFPPRKNQENDWLLLRTSYEHEINFLGAWSWQGEFRASTQEQTVLSKYLPQLPSGIRAVSVGSKGVCVYWDEKGGSVVLEKIMALLEELNNLQSS